MGATSTQWDVLRYAAFTTDPGGGNPAGIVLDAEGLDDSSMLAIAQDVGYSETAFVTKAPEHLGEPGRTYAVQYFSPKDEVSFCGHATIATAVALAERSGPGTLLFATQVGIVPVDVEQTRDGTMRATLTSVEPYVQEISPSYLSESLAALRWAEDELDPSLPPRVAYAGARHLVLAAATRGRLADLDYDFEGLAEYMAARDLTTVQLAWREAWDVFHVRNPFPVGGVVEDPATGAAAAAFGAYLRRLGEVPPSARITLHQGEDMGRPGVLQVEVREEDTRVRVSGSAVPIM